VEKKKKKFANKLRILKAKNVETTKTLKKRKFLNKQKHGIPIIEKNRGSRQKRDTDFQNGRIHCWGKTNHKQQTRATV